MAGGTSLPLPRQAKRFYHPELDIVRLFAFLAVFATHSSRPPGDHFRVYRAIADAGNFGLSLFFVLSAYLITTLLLREKDAAGTVSISKFYQRRILRIWPLYLLALTFAAIWSLHLGTLNAEKWWFVAALVMAGNFVAWPGNLAGHLWSISIEEQFYIVWPSATKWLGRARLAWLAAVLILAANVTLAYLGQTGAALDRAWGNTLVEFEMFAAGTLLALLVENPDMAYPLVVPGTDCAGSSGDLVRGDRWFADQSGRWTAGGSGSTLCGVCVGCGVFVPSDLRAAGIWALAEVGSLFWQDFVWALCLPHPMLVLRQSQFGTSVPGDSPANCAGTYMFGCGAFLPLF
jgi:peptidoglycan/LPS O-acetylase OafA/YrhL